MYIAYEIYISSVLFANEIKKIKKISFGDDLPLKVLMIVFRAPILAPPFSYYHKTIKMIHTW